MSKWRNFRVAMIFLLPAILSVVVLRLWPALLALHQSLGGPRASVYIRGNENYQFTDPVFLNSVWVTLL
jgi:multiple sugar transport system permease protein